MADWQDTAGLTPQQQASPGSVRAFFRRISEWVASFKRSPEPTEGSSDDGEPQPVDIPAKPGRIGRLVDLVSAPFRVIYSGLAIAFKAVAKVTRPILPQGLYARSLMIIITPVVILQSVVAFVFMERHWELVTERLSQAVTRDIAAVIEMVETFPDNEADQTEIIRIARDALDLNVAFLPDTALPAALPKPFFDLLDRTLSQEISQRIQRPFWIDTVGRSNLVEVRVRLSDGQVLRVFARRNQTYASNSHIFLVWMAGTSLVLLIVAVLFLRNQIRPVLRLAESADRFGRGQAIDEEMSLRGAREVRRATLAFWRMKERIERHVDQRTAMLSGVSHDLRTILTRFKLELALLKDEKAAQEMSVDVDEMQAMLEGYLAFARGDDGEASVDNNVRDLLQSAVDSASTGQSGSTLKFAYKGSENASVKPVAFKRLVTNLITNAQRHADQVSVKAHRKAESLTIYVDDNGPGIPPESYSDVFRPFYRMDEARNLDESGTGLGLAIALDIARGHGGDIALSESPLGGLRATITLPA